MRPPAAGVPALGERSDGSKYSAYGIIEERPSCHRVLWRDSACSPFIDRILA